jgi:hypothetical protein
MLALLMLAARRLEATPPGSCAQSPPRLPARSLTDLSFSPPSWRGFHIRTIGPRFRLLPKLAIADSSTTQLGIGMLSCKPAPHLDSGLCALLRPSSLKRAYSRLVVVGVHTLSHPPPGVHIFCYPAELMLMYKGAEI